MLEYGGLIGAITKLPEFAQDSPRWQVEVHHEIGRSAVVLWRGEPAQEALLIAKEQAERLISLVAAPAAKQPIAESKDRLLAAAQAMLDRTQADLAAMCHQRHPVAISPLMSTADGLSLCHWLNRW